MSQFVQIILLQPLVFWMAILQLGHRLLVSRITFEGGAGKCRVPHKINEGWGVDGRTVGEWGRGHGP